MRQVSKGAEATLFLEKNKIFKERLEKRYRHARIDSHLRKTRTSAEARLLNRARRAGLNTPQVLSVQKYTIEMSYVKGKSLKELMKGMEQKEIRKVLKELGGEIGIMHNHDIIHGDLTTSNIIIAEGKIYFIDFGLGEVSKSVEKKSTDLKLMKSIVNSTHSEHEKEFKYLLKGYERTSENAKQILDRLEGIEDRGRYVKRRAKRTLR